MNLSDTQINDLATPLVGIIKKFYEDPKNEESFQKWLQQKKSLNQTNNYRKDKPR